MTDPHDQEARRQFWARSMDRMDELLDRMVAYPCEECGEPLGSIPDAMAAAGAEVLLSETKIDGELDRIFAIRRGLLPDLAAIAGNFNQRGWILKIEDAFRTVQMQTRLGRSPRIFDRIVRSCAWECGGSRPPIELVFRRARVLIANCGRTGTHTQGAAVDVSVIRRDDGSEIWRGRPYLEMSELTPMDTPFITEAEKANRRAITEVMESHGFLHYSGEFWHYNKGDVLYQILTGSGSPGIYGPVHWDPAAGRVRPYDDPLKPLIPLEEMRIELDKALKRLAG